MCVLTCAGKVDLVKVPTGHTRLNFPSRPPTGPDSKSSNRERLRVYPRDIQGSLSNNI